MYVIITKFTIGILTILYCIGIHQSSFERFEWSDTVALLASISADIAYLAGLAISNSWRFAKRGACKLLPESVKQSRQSSKRDWSRQREPKRSASRFRTQRSGFEQECKSQVKNIQEVIEDNSKQFISYFVLEEYLR
jgi:hypothetical protein